MVIGYIMVISTDGNSEHVAHNEGKKVFSEKKIQFVTALDLNKWL